MRVPYIHHSPSPAAELIHSVLTENTIDLSQSSLIALALSGRLVYEPSDHSVRTGPHESISFQFYAEIAPIMLRNTLSYKYSLVVQLTDVRSDRVNHICH
jgi:hypothetical protein